MVMASAVEESGTGMKKAIWFLKGDRAEVGAVYRIGWCAYAAVWEK